MAIFTQIDYDREMAFIATTPEGAKNRTLGAIRAIPSPGESLAEFAMSLHPGARELGVGELLLEKMFIYQAERGVRRFVSYVHVDERSMQRLLESFNFERELQPEGNIYQFSRHNDGVQSPTL